MLVVLVITNDGGDLFTKRITHSILCVRRLPIFIPFNQSNSTQILFPS